MSDFVESPNLPLTVSNAVHNSDNNAGDSPELPTMRYKIPPEALQRFFVQTGLLTFVLGGLSVWLSSMSKDKIRRAEHKLKNKVSKKAFVKAV